jgi:hypothetical protein
LAFTRDADEMPAGGNVVKCDGGHSERPHWPAAEKLDVPAQRKPYDYRTLERHIRRLLAR